MMRRAAIGHFLALLAVVGLLLAPLVHATMAMGAADHAMLMAVTGASAAMTHAGMADMGMAGADVAGADIVSMDAMPCCPHNAPVHNAPVPDCGNDCPFMALCSAMPFGVPLATLIAPLAEARVVLPGDQSGLVGLTRAPPRKPPKHPGSPSAV
jgi:hypothetical protein